MRISPVSPDVDDSDTSAVLGFLAGVLLTSIVWIGALSLLGGV